MTLNDLKKLERDYFTPNDIAPVLGCMPYSINLQAQKDPRALGFPVICLGNRVKIPRVPFLNFMGVSDNG